ncbi:GyrI-like domain-containing protein [Maribacter halichondriae]|uniref:GyrI-like domain-containing protein n=1 Tax=Maribacter halichondriae TaxID=2980554 RepID=UPI00235830FC|nr:GyrI-like domain-containing protein [Maribacter sp. Hal144]
MKPRIETLPKKFLIGKSIRTSLTNNKTAELWQSFMVDRTAIKNNISTDLYSVQVYDKLEYFQNFNPQTEFTKWAAAEVNSIENIPNGFESFTLEGGLYAVFLHKGPANEFKRTFQFIFGQWLPNSEYVIDVRPHFEILGEKYKNDAPDSEEEVWIPIKKKY